MSSPYTLRYLPIPLSAVEPSLLELALQNDSNSMEWIAAKETCDSWEREEKCFHVIFNPKKGIGGYVFAGDDPAQGDCVRSIFTKASSIEDVAHRFLHGCAEAI